MQGVFAPKVAIGAEKTFPRTAFGGVSLFAQPSGGLPNLFVGKFLEFLKPFFQKGFKQVRTESATLKVRTKPATLKGVDKAHDLLHNRENRSYKY